MADTTDIRQTFTNLTTAAQSGQLMINSDIVSKLVSCCNNYIHDLRVQLNRTQGMVRADAFGKLGSATALGSKFDKLANDTHAGSGSLSDRINAHIATVQQMSEMFNKAGQAFAQADSETQAKIRAVTRSVN